MKKILCSLAILIPAIGLIYYFRSWPETSRLALAILTSALSLSLIFLIVIPPINVCNEEQKPLSDAEVADLMKAQNRLIQNKVWSA